MKAEVRRSLELAAGALRRLAGRVYESPAERRLQPWLRARGDETLRVEYQFGRASVVLDVGGYQGQWAMTSTRATGAAFTCSNPSGVRRPDPGALRTEPGHRSPRVRPGRHDGAGGCRAGERPLFHAPVGRRDPRDRRRRRRRVSGRPPAAAHRPHGDQHRGRRYDLLDALRDGLADRVRAFQIQFHDFVDRADERMADIQRRLSVTHRAVPVPFVWESWLKRDDWPVTPPGAWSRDPSLGVHAGFQRCAVPAAAD